ncbi:hypothetical protein Csa_014753 [Cucumis sativus]|uniref:Uncharacterized protein n=1 Tax=Cucumis sativus TaxID=3659 RepID=A0A0A0KU56_CUCSA|nr:hypothetical protein Csa_014753 [Cucumis sativus]
MIRSELDQLKEFSRSSFIVFFQVVVLVWDAHAVACHCLAPYDLASNYKGASHGNNLTKIKSLCLEVKNPLDMEVLSLFFWFSQATV